MAPPPPPLLSSPPTWQLTILLSYSLLSMALLAASSPSSSSSHGLSDIGNGRQDICGAGEFLCRTTRSYRDPYKKCVYNSQVCDGKPDCEDHSDEWRSLCSRVCLSDYDDGLRFKCERYRSVPRALEDPLHGEASNSTEGLVDDPRLGEASNFQNPRNQTTFPSVHDGNHQAVVRNNRTGLNFWIGNCRFNDDTIPLFQFCDVAVDCRLTFIRRFDEDHCLCVQNQDCPKRSMGGGGDWWMRIIATTIGIIVLFGFCVCAAVQWEKHRVGLLIRRRERQRNEAINRRSTPSLGQVNLGASLSAAEFNNRARAAGGAAVAPPPYSAALAFPKPEVVSEPGEMPPPYQPEWVGTFQARAVAAPDPSAATMAVAMTPFERPAMATARPKSPPPVCLPPAAPIYVPITPPTAFVTSNPAATVTVAIATTAGTDATTAVAASSISGMNCSTEAVE